MESVIAEDMRRAAASMADVAVAAGYAFDMSAASLRDVERFLDEQTHEGQPRPGGLLSKDLGSRVFALGAYVGEVIRQAIGGEWVADDGAGIALVPDSPHGSDSSPEPTAAMRLPNGAVLWPGQQVMKRILAGPSQSIVEYAASAGVDLGPNPRHPAQQV